MERIQNIYVALALLTMCFSGCLGTDDNADYALQMMIEKSLDKDGARLFQDGDKASLRREIEASILEQIQLAMLQAGADKEVKQAKADLKS